MEGPWTQVTSWEALAALFDPKPGRAGYLGLACPPAPRTQPLLPPARLLPSATPQTVVTIPQLSHVQHVTSAGRRTPVLGRGAILVACCHGRGLDDGLSPG